MYGTILPMNGWLVINSFAQTGESLNLFELLKEAAERAGIRLETLRTVDLASPINGTDRTPGPGYRPSYPINGADRTPGTGNIPSSPVNGEQSDGPPEKGSGDGSPENKADPGFVLFWDKDVLLARTLEARGMRLFNRAQAIETCDSKALTAIALKDQGVPQPLTFISPKTFEYFGYNDPAFLSVYEEALGYPYVIKEEFGSFGLGVHLVGNRAEAEALVGKLGAKTFIAQRFIRESAGRDLRIYVVGGRVIASMIRENKNDFRSNVFQGGTGLSHSPSPEEEALAIRAAEAVNCDFCGVDLLIGGNDPLVCEVNSNAHFTGLLRCTGINVADSIFRHIFENVRRSS